MYKSLSVAILYLRTHRIILTSRLPRSIIDIIKMIFRGVIWELITNACGNY